MAEVVTTDPWPRILETTSIGTPSRSILVAANVPQPVRAEAEADLHAQPPDQVIDRRVGQRLAPRLGEQVDEHVIGIELAVLEVQVVAP